MSRVHREPSPRAPHEYRCSVCCKRKKEATALIEPELSSQSDVSLTASKISISDLLDYVNRD